MRGTPDARHRRKGGQGRVSEGKGGWVEAPLAFPRKKCGRLLGGRDAICMGWDARVGELLEGPGEGLGAFKRAEEEGERPGCDSAWRRRDGDKGGAAGGRASCPSRPEVVWLGCRPLLA